MSDSQLKEPTRPTHMSNYAEACLQALAASGLWQRRQQLSGSDTDSMRARLAMETHMERIAQHRPLAQIADPVDRTAAEQLRTWFAEFLNVLQD